LQQPQPLLGRPRGQRQAARSATAVAATLAAMSVAIGWCRPQAAKRLRPSGAARRLGPTLRWEWRRWSGSESHRSLRPARWYAGTRPPGGRPARILWRHRQWAATLDQLGVLGPAGRGEASGAAPRVVLPHAV